MGCIIEIGSAPFYYAIDNKFCDIHYMQAIRFVQYTQKKLINRQNNKLSA